MIIWTFITLKSFPCRKGIFEMSYVCGFLKWTKYVENWIQVLLLLTTICLSTSKMWFIT